MDVIEKAIRGAFEKGNGEDKAFREKVYRSAFAALDRALQANPSVTVETAIARRKSLQAKITEIESEFIPAVPEIDPAIFDFSDDGSAPPAVEPDKGQAPSAPDVEPVVAPIEKTTAEVEPVVRPVEATAAKVEPVAPPVDTSASSVRTFAPTIEVTDKAEAPSASRAEPFLRVDSPSRAEPSFEPESSVRVPVERGQPEDPTAFTAPDVKALDMPSPQKPEPFAEDAANEVSVDPDAAVVRERRRPYAAMFIAVTLFTAGAIGIWWAAETGLLKSAAERDTGVPNPPQTLPSEDFIPEDEEPVQAPQKTGETDALTNWISVFTPEDANRVNAPTDTSAEMVEDDEGSALRIRSGTSGSAILFDVGQGILEQVAGKRAIFDIVARSEEGKETQISVSCNFGELGDCGRKRYAVGHERGEFLFEIEFPQGQPGAGGTIAISSDISNQGKAVDIYEIKVSVGE